MLGCSAANKEIKKMTNITLKHIAEAILDGAAEECREQNLKDSDAVASYACNALEVSISDE